MPKQPVQKQKNKQKPAAGHKSAVDLSLDGVRKFIKFAGQFPLSKLSVGKTGARLTVYQNPAAGRPAAGSKKTELKEASAPPTVREQIKSDRVGVLHSVKDIKIGGRLKSGETAAKIYAIGLAHEIKAPRDCVIKEIFAQENDLIEYGQPLFAIE
ncbi:hypothetical protein NO2_1447 [Candidatus Termititenax persephonae]|uniref:Lipoyl-binding domain-containing protein n=1 Tax=Candidatus Termititenax persephonae TaxID=2218525 RepID=A0A388TJ11_9BACT|nr:hypothetical protein NO2_1447 [Candidatus Termititenax persephonae]